MVLYILFYLFMFVSIIEVIHFGLYIVGANFYDIQKFRQQKFGTKRSYGPRPLVSVLIPAHNEEAGIARCLDSVRRSSARKIQIIVIDDASTDNTKKVVREYIKKHSNRNISLMYKQKNVGKAGALNHALKNGAEGDIIMTLDADSVLHKNAIANAVSYFSDPTVAGVAANVRVMQSNTFLGILQRFEYMVGYRSKKFYSVTNSEYIVGGVASTYRRSVLKSVQYYDDDVITEDIGLSLKVITQGNRENRLVFGYDVLAMTEGVQTFKALLRQRYRWKMGSLQSLLKYRRLFANTNSRYSRSLTFYRIPMAFIGEFVVLLEPLAIAFVVYASIAIMSPALFVSAYATIGLYLLWNLWPDEHMDTTQKIKLTMYVPFLYFAFYTMNIVQFSAMIRCLLNPRQVLRKAGADGSKWVSPERSAKTHVQFT